MRSVQQLLESLISEKRRGVDTDAIMVSCFVSLVRKEMLLVKPNMSSIKRKHVIYSVYREEDAAAADAE